MVKKTDSPGAIAIREAASLAAQKLAALEAEAKAVEPSAARKSLRLISSKAGGVQALITAGPLTIQVQDGDFSVEIAEANPSASA